MRSYSATFRGYRGYLPFDQYNLTTDYHKGDWARELIMEKIMIPLPLENTPKSCQIEIKHKMFHHGQGTQKMMEGRIQKLGETILYDKTNKKRCNIIFPSKDDFLTNTNSPKTFLHIKDNLDQQKMPFYLEIDGELVINYIDYDQISAINFDKIHQTQPTSDQDFDLLLDQSLESDLKNNSDPRLIEFYEKFLYGEANRVELKKIYQNSQGQENSKNFNKDKEETTIFQRIADILPEILFFDVKYKFRVHNFNSKNHIRLSFLPPLNLRVKLADISAPIIDFTDKTSLINNSWSWYDLKKMEEENFKVGKFYYGHLHNVQDVRYSFDPVVVNLFERPIDNEASAAHGLVKFEKNNFFRTKNNKNVYHFSIIWICKLISILNKTLTIPLKHKISIHHPPMKIYIIARQHLIFPAMTKPLILPKMNQI